MKFVYENPLQKIQLDAFCLKLAILCVLLYQFSPSSPIQYLSVCTPVLVSRSHSEWICICHLIVFVCARHLHFQSADPIPMGFASAGHV